MPSRVRPLETAQAAGFAGILRDLGFVGSCVLRDQAALALPSAYSARACSAASSWRPPRCDASRGLRELKGLMPIVARSRADSWDLGRRVSRRLPCGDVRRSLT